MDKFSFKEIYNQVISLWPDIIPFEDNSSVCDLESDISAKLIGVDYELIYREMSSSILIVICDEFKFGQSINKSMINQAKVKAMYEERISEWVPEDDGFTSDMEGKQKYFEANS